MSIWPGQIHSTDLEQVKNHDFSGVHEEPEVRRFYPYGQAAGQVLGFTNIDNKGGSGIELAKEKLLEESRGQGLAKVDAFGQRVPGGLQEHRTPRNGISLILTLDIAYQGILEEELARAIAQSEAESGLGIIADPNTGEILAMANLPLYDPNDPASAPARLHRNRTITDSFEPGSTFKAITTAAILEQGLIQPADSIFCEEGELDLGYGARLRDVKPHGWLSFREIIEKSSNIGIAKAAQGLKRRDFYAWIRKFGFGGRTGIDLPGESSGQLGHVNKWSARSLETLAIGQEIGVTALQLVQAFGAIANGGMLMAPKIVRQELGPDGQVIRQKADQSIRRVVSEETAAKVRQLLRGAVEQGTGQQADIEGVEVAGKTGTRAAGLGQGGGLRHRRDHSVVYRFFARPGAAIALFDSY